MKIIFGIYKVPINGPKVTLFITKNLKYAHIGYQFSLGAHLVG